MTDRAVVTESEVRTPRLEDVQSRRRQLFRLLLLVLIMVGAGVVLVSIAERLLGQQPPAWLSPDVVRVAFVLLAVAFAIYVHEKERALERTERALIEERVLSTALSSRVGELTAISQAGRAVASTLSLGDVLQLILRSAQDLLGATEGSVMLFDETKSSLRIAASVGLSADAAKQTIPIGEGVAGWVAEFREAVILRGDVSDPRFRRLVPKDRPVRYAMSAPLYARSEPVGVLNISVSNGERVYSEHDLRALTVFAEHAAIAIANARLFELERAASERLAEVDARRREFLAVVTHDLKSPLTSIIGYVRLLNQLGENATVEQAREFNRVIEKQATRMLDMIEQLLMATSIEEGARVLSREPMDLRAIIGEEVAAFAGVLGDRVIDMRIPVELPTVYGDRSAIEHILANLLDNAVKYSPDGTAIEVMARPEPDEIRVSVGNDGKGIPEEELPRIFDRYKRGDGAAREGSVGLGLFIVRSLTLGHGGRVWAENRDGGGTRITFTLPLRRESERVSA
ncbi:MAG TPA: ATP-binding protein [Actinomycetota bacterium]|nr:ATP-binding protein [Actinomycetota bacterium]